MDISSKIQASSHSGATLQVLQESGEYFVRKQIHSAIDKNLSAIQKQRRFKSIKTPSYDIIAIPVTDIDHQEDELSIMMPYIEGLGGEQVAYKGSKTVAKNLKVALDFYLINGIALSDDQLYPVDSVIDKLEQISNNLEDKWSLFPDLESHLATFKQYCNKDLLMPMGECHGDLTLSNLKVTEENQLALFDFLTCEINSPIQDAAKLIQDFEYGWSFRKEKVSVRIKGEIFCEHAMPSFLKTLDRLFFYEMRVVETLTILRIAPYIQEQDNVTIDWFNNVMKKTMRKIIG
ncbi:phosphotransferase [Vibrio sp. 10N.261.51.F12]|uniref:phosphotransferase n=1 Tax=Vibrio sp. 10N.261.51.F12 TaxID=3229679 RepID=UPI00354D93F7